MTDKQAPDRNLAMELVRVTEAAALAASRWMGRGDKNGADGAAVDAMRFVLSSVAERPSVRRDPPTVRGRTPRRTGRPISGMSERPTG